MKIRTRLKDDYGAYIFIGDILDVCEYPFEIVGGSLDYRGIVEIRDGIAVCTYYDIGEEEYTPISHFPISGRHICNEAERYAYWKTFHLGEEPPEYLWNNDLYRDYFGSKYPKFPWKR